MLWSPAPWMERKKGLPSQELDRISLNSRPMFKWVVTSLHCSGAFLILQSRPGQRPGLSPQCTDCIGPSAPLLELLSYISCFYMWIVWVTLVGIFWTVAPCFPFSGKCSLSSVYCVQQYTMENAVLPWLKEGLPWFGEFVDMRGRPHAARLTQPLQSIWKHLECYFRYCLPSQHSWCQNERRGLLWCGDETKVPLLLCQSCRPTIEGIV